MPEVRSSLIWPIVLAFLAVSHHAAGVACVDACLVDNSDATSDLRNTRVVSRCTEFGFWLAVGDLISQPIGFILAGRSAVDLVSRLRDWTSAALVFTPFAIRAFTSAGRR